MLTHFAVCWESLDAMMMKKFQTVEVNLYFSTKKLCDGRQLLRGILYDLNQSYPWVKLMEI